MYCERCNVDFPEGLRYCKWCGGALKERSRDTSELKTCPSCKAAVKSSWAFCKSCGEKLGAPEIGGSSPAGSQAAVDAPAVICSNCGEQLDASSLYCKGCGSPVQQPAEDYAMSALLCAVCNSYSPVGSNICSVCGASFAGPVPQRQDRAPNTLVDVEDTGGTHAGLGSHRPQAEQPELPEGTIIMASYPAPGGQAGEQGTKSISSSERADHIATSSPAADSQRFDELKIVDAESDTSYIEPETLIVETGTGEIGSSGAVTGIQNFHEANTAAIPDLGETLTEQSIETTMLDRGRTTSPVEGQDEEEESSFKDASTRPISDLGDRGEALDQFAGRLEQPYAGERTVSFGTAPPPPSGELQPEPIDPKSYVTGSETTEPSPPVLPKFGEAPTKPIDNAPGPFSDPTTAPFGMGQYPPQPQTVSRPQQPWPEQPGMPAPMAGPETRVAPVVQPQKRGNLAAVLSVVLGGVILLMAGIIFWWYVSGGRGQEPAVQEDVAVNPPAPEPPPPSEVKPPPVPEGMVLVPGGRYIIGRDDGDELASPQRAVDVAPFYIDITEVTNAEYMLFIDARKRQPPAEWNGDTYPQDRADWPVTGISWQDAADYAAWAGKRLPTEIEWEAAARGPDGRIYPWGNEWKRGLANIGTRGIRGVAQYKEGASPVGAFDMLGNVWEWTADEFALYPGSSAQMPSNIQPGINYRVIRGGAYDGSKINDSSYRGYVDASQGYPKTGFRCVKDAR